MNNSRETHGGDSITPGPDVSNAAGTIRNLNVAGNVSYLECKPGSRRSSHWHRSDWHYLYVIYGYMNYYERPVGSDSKPSFRRVAAGEMVFTGPNVEHWSEFPVMTAMISVSRLHRTNEQHEADLVRVGWFE
jgi:quercetin dioxygenase-like cupin family protein